MYNLPIVQEQGWSDESLVMLAQRFLIDRSLLREFEAFLQEVADSENSDGSCYPPDGFMTDAEADADVLRSAGWGTDEDYGLFTHEDDY